MATSPSRRRVRRLVAAGGIAVLVAASAGAVSLRTEPSKADYLEPDDARRALTRISVLARTDQVAGVTFARDEATFRMVRGKQVETWIARPGREVARAGTGTSRAVIPIRIRDLDLPRIVERVRTDDVGSTCKPTTLKAEVNVSFAGAITHVRCLDGARHSWLDADADKLADVDPRTAEGLTRALADLRRATGAREVSYVAIRYGGEDAGVDLETPGACGDLARCDALVTARRAHVESRDPAIATRGAPARLNYAELVPLDSVDPVGLHATIEHMTQTRKGVDWWRGLTVTLYQRPGNQPRLEFKQGSTVFWTDLNGAEARF
ncbi:hypothetical protein GCM10027418_02150 [Mariniluteicoccus endophyticus]